MRSIPTTVLALLLVASVQAHADAAPPRYFDLVNTSFDSVRAVAVAPAGGDAFAALDLGAPLPGGHASATVALPDGDCLRDFRVEFADGRRLLYPGIDVCRHGRLQLRPRDGR